MAKNVNKIFYLLCLLWLMTAGRCHGQVKDSIFLFNGQILIGDLKGGQYGEINIDDIDLKMMQVKLYKIKVLITSRKFRIEMNTKKVYIGTIKAAGLPGWVTIFSNNEQPVSSPIQNISMIIPLEKDFFSRLSGTLSAGFSYTKSSSEGQINISSTILYATKLFEYQLSVSFNGSLDSSTFSRDRETIGLFGSYSISPAWFAAVYADYERNLELSIARRFQQLLGGGNKIIVKKNLQLLVLSGLAFNQEKSVSGESSQLLLEIPFMTRFNFFQYHRPNIQISSSQSVFFSLSQKGRIRYSGNTNFSWELVRYFYLTFSPYTSFDSQPPQNSSNFDYGAVLSLSYKF